MQKTNSFLTQLLDFEVSGKGAISAPGNWIKAPLLSIRTDVDDTIDKLAPQLISQRGANKTGVWWFLVGSPGNGKSAAVGTLVRTLKETYNSEFREPKDSSGKPGRELEDFDENDIPYVLELYEDGNNFASALFAQDASVVPSPYDSDPNTGAALIDLLEDASAKGQSVVVCANRGVIEKALQQKADKSAPWYQALKAIHDSKGSRTIKFDDSGSRKLVFEDITVEVTTLDEKSIVADNTFGMLLDKATSNSGWSNCDGCSSSDECPYKNNRDWLKSEEGKSRFITVLRYAELMSGQAIVFREALAFIALMLAGTSRDYKGDITPCGWVHERVNKGALFSLLSRRIYMLLFKSHSPFGLENGTKDKADQLTILTESANLLPEVSTSAIKALNTDKIATDVGLKRFLSVEGIFAEIDPVKENQGKEREQRWNIATGKSDLVAGQPLISSLEKKCFSIWADCEDLTDKIKKQDVAHNYYRELRRWITSVTYRLGFFAEGDLLFEEELKEYQVILDINDNKELTEAQEDLKDAIQDSFKEFVFGSDSPMVKISKVLTVFGRTVNDQLDPELDLSAGRKTRLVMRISENELELSPRSFAWLRRKSRTGLSDKTFPPDVQQVADDIRYKAASYIEYAFIPKGIKLQIKKPNGDILELERKTARLKELRNNL